jgi:hypothetical protein
MDEQITNRLPWAEAASSVSLSDPMRARAAQRFFTNKRFASSKNQAKRGLIRRLVDVVFDSNLSIIDMAQQIRDEIKENSDAKALNACVDKIEQLGAEGWYRADIEWPSATLHHVDLEIAIYPDAVLKDEKDHFLLLYAYYRKSPPLNTDAIRALLYLIRIFGERCDALEDARIVVLDCYNDKSYEGSDFQGSEPWIKKQIDRVFSTYNATYRSHLDGTPPSQTSINHRPGRKARVVRIGRTDLSRLAPEAQLCLQYV